MYQLTHLAGDRDRERLAHAKAQRPATRALALARATRRAERAERRARRAARQAQRLRAQLQGPGRHRPVTARRPPPATPTRTTTRRSP